MNCTAAVAAVDEIVVLRFLLLLVVLRVPFFEELESFGCFFNLVHDFRRQMECEVV